MDVTIQLVPTATVSGKVTSPSGALAADPLGGSRAGGGAYGMLAGAGLRGLSAQPSADGKFAFTGVAPGTYTIKTQLRERTRRSRPTQPTLWAAAEVTVSGQDLDVPLTLQPGVAINGRVVFDGSQPTAAELQTLSFMLVPPGSGGTALHERRRTRGCGGTLHVRERHA